MSVFSGKSFIPLYIVLAMSFFLDGLDGTIVTIALPTIGQSFGIDTSASSWIVTIYFLFMAGLILILGRFAGSGHLKIILAGGFTVFALSSLMCALSVSLEMMLVFRAVQGIGGAMLAASAVLVPLRFLPAEKLSYALAITLLGSSLGTAMGPVLGGIITELVSWQWVFLINVPVGILCTLLVMKVIPKDSEKTESRFDKSGSVLLFIALVCGLYVIEALPSNGLTGYIPVLIAAFLVSFVVLLLLERRVSDPVLDFSLFKSWKFDAVTFAYIAVNLVHAGVMYLLPFYLSIVLNMGTMMSGILLFIPSAMILLLCLPVSKSAEIRGHRLYATLSVSMIIITSAVLAVVNPTMSVLYIVFALVTHGLMWGFGSGSISARLLLTAPKGKEDRASSIISFMIYFGSAIGTALYSGLFTFGSGTGSTPISELLPEDFVAGFNFVMMIGIAIGVLATVASLVVKDRRSPHIRLTRVHSFGVLVP